MSFVQRSKVDGPTPDERLEDGKVRRERKPTIDHVFLEDPLEAPRHDQLDTGSLVCDDGRLTARPRTVRISADDNLETAPRDVPLSDGILEVVEEVRPENLAGVTQDAGRTADDRVGVDPILKPRAGGRQRVPALQLCFQQRRFFRKPQHAPFEPYPPRSSAGLRRPQRRDHLR